jgi:hypothetical protein
MAQALADVDASEPLRKRLGAIDLLARRDGLGLCHRRPQQPADGNEAGELPDERGLSAVRHG